MRRSKRPRHSCLLFIVQRSSFSVSYGSSFSVHHFLPLWSLKLHAVAIRVAGEEAVDPGDLVARVPDDGISRAFHDRCRGGDVLDPEAKMVSGLGILFIAA